MKQVKKLLLTLLVFTIILGVVGCASDSGTSTDNESDKTEISQDAEQQNEEVTIKFFSNIADRTTGMGKLEQDLLDQYMAKNEKVTIEVEALGDEAYKQKFQAYVASNSLPDVAMVWGMPAFLQAVMENGYVEALNEDDYTEYGFFEGSLNDFTYDGKLYGLPRGQDVTVIYYNKEIFESNNVKVPTTYSELLEATKIFREKGISPMSINGKDKWILNLFFQDLALKVSGDQKSLYNAIDQKSTFIADEDTRKAAELYSELIEAGLFQDSYLSADYSAARNLFVQEQAAMYYMGAWEVGMASSDENSESFKNNVEVIPFPIVEEGKGLVTDLVAWNGGGYAVSSNSEVKEEAIKLLNYMMAPENWVKTGWQTGATVPAQNYTDYLTGNENQLQKSVTALLSDSTSMSGTPWLDYAPGEWKSNCENLVSEFSAGIIDVDEFLDQLDKAAQLQ